MSDCVLTRLVYTYPCRSGDERAYDTTWKLISISSQNIPMLEDGQTTALTCTSLPLR